MDAKRGNQRFCWVTGASGFVGAHLARDLEAARGAVCAIGGVRPVAAELGAAQALNLDLTSALELADAVRQYPPSAIVHAAALADAARCEREPQLAERANVLATKALCQLAASENIPLIFISTDLVFDGNGPPAKGGFRENDQSMPRGVYARTKRAAEELVLAYARGAVCRTALVYGERLGTEGGFLAWMKNTLEEGQALSLFVDEYRTPIYAADLSPVVAKLLAADCQERILHLAGPVRLSRFEFGELFCEIGGFDRSLLVPVRQAEVESSFKRPADVSFCTERARNLGFSFTSPEQALRKICAGT